MHRLRFAAIYSVAWLPLACVYSVLIFLQGGGEASVSSAVAGAVSTTFTAALLGLAAWYAGRRITRSAEQLPRFLGIHLVLALAYAAAWTGIIVLSLMAFAPGDVATEFVRQAVGWQLLSGVMLYGLVAGTSYAVTVSEKLRHEQEATARAEALRARAELEALRARMNPHFLFNTLHSVIGLARSDPAAVEATLERFADLVRYILEIARDRRDEVAFADEWAFVENYLELERLRLGDRLTVVKTLDPDTLDFVVPVFVLQPLVENAVRHGIAPRASGGTIRVTARSDGETLRLEVADDGVGATSPDVSQPSGMGIAAVRQRMLAHYGAGARMDVITAPGEGFIVRLSLPAESSHLVEAKDL